jgi:hypothetical protein
MIGQCQTAIRGVSSFPAAPSIQPKNREQGIDQKRLFDTGRTSKKFLP